MSNPLQSPKNEASDATIAYSTGSKRGVQFWSIFVAIVVALFTAALDLTAVSTALPTIVADLNGSQFVWVGSAYALSATAFLPLSGGLAQV